MRADDLLKNIELFPHQLRAIESCIKHPATALLMEQRTGKTPPTIATMGYRYLKGQIKKVLIIAPLTVLSEWQRQIKQYAAFRYSLTTLSGSALHCSYVVDGWKLRPGLNIILVNYDKLPQIKIALGDWEPDLVICDESHLIKNIRARRTKAIIYVRGNCPYRMALTGTPMSRGPVDFFGQYSFLDDRILGTSLRAFERRYVIKKGLYQKIVGAKNEEELARKLHAISFRVRKKDVAYIPFEDRVLDEIGRAHV